MGIPSQDLSSHAPGTNKTTSLREKRKRNYGQCGFQENCFSISLPSGRGTLVPLFSAPAPHTCPIAAYDSHHSSVCMIGMKVLVINGGGWSLCNGVVRL